MPLVPGLELDREPAAEVLQGLSQGPDLVEQEAGLLPGVVHLGLDHEHCPVLDLVADLRPGAGEHRHRDRAVQVLQAEAGHLHPRRAPLPDHVLRQLQHEAGDAHLRAAIQVPELGDGAAGEQGADPGALLQRVAREVVAQDLVLQGQGLRAAQLDGVVDPIALGDRLLGATASHGVEHRDLTRAAVGRRVVGVLHGALQGGQDRPAPVAGLVERAGLDQRLPADLPDDRRVGLLHDAVEPEGLLVLLQSRSGCDDLLDRLLARALDGAEPEADPPLTLGEELPVGVTDGGRGDLDVAASALVEEGLHLVRVAHLAREVGGQERSAVVRLQVRRLVRDQGVGGGVRLVEAVAPELDDVVPDLLRHVPCAAVRLGAVEELRGELLHDLRLLLAHRLAQVVCVVEREAGEFHRCEHDLLLVDDAAVGVLQDLLEALVVVGDGLTTVLAVHEHLDHA